MPYLLDTRATRRHFLGRAGALAAGLIGASRQAGASQAPSTLRLALLSDTHIPADATEAYRGFVPVRNLAEVAAQVSRADVHGAILGGDLARLSGEPGDYAALRTLLAPISDRVPVGLILGNHDHRAHFATAFPASDGAAQPVADKHVMVVERGGQRFVLLDSLLAPNVTPGQLGRAQRTWLRDYLATAAPLPTSIVVHHTLDDSDIALVDVEHLFAVLRPFPQVKAILYGHSHRYAVEARDGIQLINLPAVGYNFADDQPVGWIASTWTAEGVELTLHAIGGNRRGDGQTRAVRWLR